ncbi:MAG: Flp pilus assembly complex ATPase component TadA [Armatimonadetes bacterium]|nr:Flp pilus assembly complex ATPase component TadA [Armatimonadota bacterium]
MEDQLLSEPTPSRLGEICVTLGKISPTQLVEVLTQQKQTGQRFGDILRDRGYVGERDIAEAMAVQLGVPFHDLENTPAQESVAALLPAQAALTFVMLPVRMGENDQMRLAMLNPADTEAIEVATRLSGKTPEPVLCESAVLRRALSAIYGSAAGDALSPLPFGGDEYAAAAAMTATATALSPVQTALAALSHVSGVDDISGAARELLAALLDEAVQIGAMSVAIEPVGGYAQIAYRLPHRQQRRAVLRSAHRLPRPAQTALLAEIKREANADPAERRRPQRGWLPPITEAGMPLLDLRVSLLPELHGERVLIQLLRRDPVQAHLLERFQLPNAQKTALADLLARRGGLVLVTGQHWLETLYNLAGVFSADENATGRTVATCEQAVRYELPHLSQYVVEPMESSPEAIAIAVANAVDALLSQDPDVVIANASAAHPRIAAAVCRVSSVASATSPLVLVGISAAGDALDTAGAATALKQAVGSEVAANALLGVYTERRLRRLCLSCRELVEADDATATRLGIEPGENVYRAVGCARCEKTGYVGEFDVQEVLVCDNGFTRLLRENVDAWTLRHYAAAHGMVALKDTAVARVRAGLTSPAELIAQGIV